MISQTPVTMKFEVPTKPKEQKYSSLPYMKPSLVDFQLLLDSEDELQTFGSYLNSWGSFQLVNHGIPSSKLDQVLELCNEFFNLPLEERQKYAKGKGEVQGFTRDAMSEDNDFKTLDWFLVAVHPLQFRVPRLWLQETLPKFREILEEYTTELRRILEVVCRAMSKYLKLEDDNLLNKYAKDPYVVARMNKYPPYPFPEEVIGLKPHSDMHMFAFLLPDKEVEGLHVEKDGQWYRVPIVPDALVINVADMLEILSNGRIKSVYHRVVLDKTRERISVAVGFGPPKNTKIEPLVELITDETPQLYKSGESYFEVAIAAHASGQRAIDAMKISKPSEILV